MALALFGLHALAMPLLALHFVGTTDRDEVKQRLEMPSYMFRKDVVQLRSGEEAALRRFERRFVTKLLRTLLRAVAAYIISILVATLRF